MHTLPLIALILAATGQQAGGGGGATNAVTVWPVGADPSGSCTGSRIVITSAGYIYTCSSGTWARRVGTTPTAAAPTFSPPAGVYDAPISVTVGTASTGATVYCTTDGTTPSTSSAVYSVPFSVSSIRTISCIAAGGGFFTSPVASAAYSGFTPDFYAAFTGSPCQTTISGTGISVTNNRNSVAWVTQAGAEYQCAATQNRIGDLGVLAELGVTQYVTAPDAPTTEAVSMPSGGAFNARMVGAGSVALDFTSASGTGLPCTVTASSACSFTISSPGTVTWTPSGQVSLLNVVNWNKASSSVHSAMTRAADGTSFTTPAVSNNYCLLTSRFSPYNGTFANMIGTTGIIGAGWSGNNRTYATISTIGSIVGNFVDSSGGVKTLTVGLSAVEMLTGHSLALCRSAAGVVSMYMDGIRVGVEAGAGTGIASTTPATPTYVGASGGQNGPIWVSDVGYTADSTNPWLTLETRSRMDCLGDSITNGYGSSTSYPATLQTLLGSGFAITNSGVSGQVTSQILGRYQTGQIQDRRYEFLLVLAGINDIRTDVAVATIESNLQTIYDAHRAQGGKLIIATMLPFRGSTDYSAGREANRLTVNTWIRGYAAANSVRLVDAAASFDDGTAAMKTAWDSGDHLHPGAAGYIELAQEFYAAGHTAGYW